MAVRTTVGLLYPGHAAEDDLSSLGRRSHFGSFTPPLARTLTGLTRSSISEAVAGSRRERSSCAALTSMP